MKKYSFLNLLLLFSLFACNDDDAPVVGERVRISAQISGMTPEEGMSRFRGGAGVGMFIVDNPVTTEPDHFSFSEARVRNEKYMQSADGLVGEKEMTWNSSKEIGFVGYYPWVKGVEENVESMLFTVSERQDALVNNLSAYEESDFLWARTVAKADADPVNMTFKHLMSKVIVYLKSDALVPGDMVGSKVRIKGIKNSTLINLQTGTSSPTGETTEVVAQGMEAVKIGFERAARAVLVPQSVQSGTPFLEIETLGGYSYHYDLSRDLVLEPGKQLTLDVEISSGECHVTIGEITDWTENDSPVFGDVEEDLPAFKVLDLYDINGVQGIVISTDETGKHGIIMSLDKSGEIQWSTSGTPTVETNQSDGIAAMKKIMASDPTLATFPAVKWCMDKNPGEEIKWYLPAKNELKVMLELLAADFDLFNEKLETYGGTPVSIDPDWGDSEYYWTSTVSWTGRVTTGYNSLWYGISWSSASSDDTENRSFTRAFYKF